MTLAHINSHTLEVFWPSYLHLCGCYDKGPSCLNGGCYVLLLAPMEFIIQSTKVEVKSGAFLFNKSV